MKLVTVILFVIGAVLSVSLLSDHALSQTACVPHIDSIDPAEGPLNSEATLHGSCFGDGTASVVLPTKNFVTAFSLPGSWTDSSIAVQIHGPPAGEKHVSVRTPAGVSNEVTFVLLNYCVPSPHSTCPNPTGEIAVKLLPDANIEDVTAAHGDTDFRMHFPGPFDPILSRWWLIKVADGTELERVAEYAADPRIEWADMILGICLDDPVPSPSVTPSPTAVPTPAALPKTGGPPAP